MLPNKEVYVVLLRKNSVGIFPISSRNIFGNFYKDNSGTYTSHFLLPLIRLVYHIEYLCNHRRYMIELVLWAYLLNRCPYQIASHTNMLFPHSRHHLFDYCLQIETLIFCYILYNEGSCPSSTNA